MSVFRERHHCVPSKSDKEGIHNDGAIEAFVCVDPSVASVEPVIRNRAFQLPTAFHVVLTVCSEYPVDSKSECIASNWLEEQALLD